MSLVVHVALLPIQYSSQVCLESSSLSLFLTSYTLSVLLGSTYFRLPAAQDFLFRLPSLPLSCCNHNVFQHRAASAGHCTCECSHSFTCSSSTFPTTSPCCQTEQLDEHNIEPLRPSELPHLRRHRAKSDSHCPREGRLRMYSERTDQCYGSCPADRLADTVHLVAEHDCLPEESASRVRCESATGN